MWYHRWYDRNDTVRLYLDRRYSCKSLITFLNELLRLVPSYVTNYNTDILRDFLERITGVKRIGVLERITGTWVAYAAGAYAGRRLRGGRTSAVGAPPRRALLAEGCSFGGIFTKVFLNYIYILSRPKMVHIFSKQGCTVDIINKQQGLVFTR